MACPPFIVASTSAATLWSAMIDPPERCKLYKELLHYVHRTEGNAAIVVRNFTADNATANDCFSAAVADAHPTDLMSYLPCGNHQHNLCEGSLYTTLGLDAIRFLQVITSLTKLGPHFLKLITVLISVITCLLTIRRGEPPETTSNTTAEIKDWYLNTYFKQNRSFRARRGRRRKKTAAWRGGGKW